MSNTTGFSDLDRLSRRIADEQLIAPLWPHGDGVTLLDQTRLPFEREVVMIRTANEMARAVQQMQIRGSGAIGCAGALGAYLAVREDPNDSNSWDSNVRALRSARPTAIALQQAINEVLASARQEKESPLDAAAAASAGFVDRQLEMERAIGRHGAEIVPEGATILTHCHSGALAGAGYGGRALSVIRTAAEMGKKVQVISQETRPYLQGARITAWELRKLGIPVKLITDGMSGAVMANGWVDVCVVGSDRLAINGDLANKVGTSLVALAAREHGVPFYTATTRYNVDPTCSSGADIPIEMRSGEEVLDFSGHRITVEGVEALYPAFDITPASLLTGIVTEAGLLRPPFEPQLRSLSRHDETQNQAEIKKNPG